MWNAYAITLAGASISLLLVVSLLLAFSDTITSLRDLFDPRILRRALRDAKRMRIGSMLWLTGYVAISFAIYSSFENSPLPYLIIPFVGIMLLLTRTAIHSMTDQRIRRLPSKPNFKSLDHLPDDQKNGG
ncbi:hypothetical protein FYK55_17120 [Roseiconus nitratireducens]|uniref:Uncharacterized protein n=1 Tax=Roseiconus nitratireducens TaxID=2605748 RepID=A0A5M6D322_9BACT|nr:hypothetical protein [Roseiconus nitratireducens]KAA5541917.1 hypothetical protein FYK55_17120 [Roseiconus nitratireducens]